MPGFRININGDKLVAVSADGLTILSVQIHGDVIGEELAELHVSGSKYKDESTDSHLIWIDQYRINAKDEIEIFFSDSVTTSYYGKTIDELYPHEKKQQGDNQKIEELFSGLSLKPKNRDYFRFKLTTPSGEVVCPETSTDDFSFNFIVMWKWLHPDRASVWLSSNTIRGITERENGTSHARLVLKNEQSIKLNIGT